MTRLALRFVMWNVGVRLCDVIGRPLDAVIARVPWLNERTGACIVLHGMTPRFGTIPETWWDRAGWRKP